MTKPPADLHPPGPTKVLAAAATGTVGFFQKHGGDVDGIFGRVGLPIEHLSNPLAELNLKQYCALFEEAAEETGNGNIGLEFGQNFDPRQLGMLGFSALSAPTLGAAIRNMERFFPAHQGQTGFGLIEESGILWLSYRIMDSRIRCRRQDAELSLGMFCNIFKAALGQDWAPLEVRFEHPRPAGASAHEMHFGAPVQFGRRTNAFAFRRSDLKALMPEQDPYLAQVVRAYLENRCQQQSGIVDFAKAIKHEIKMNLGESLPALNEIAEIFGMSEVTFKKHLRERGLIFGDILKAARQELALHYMADPDLSLTEIAASLGYSELSAFSRAFSNWTGLSPQAYRKSSGRP